MIYFYNVSKKLRLYYKTEMSLATRVSPKKILHWANFFFSEHEYFKAELSEF